MASLPSLRVGLKPCFTHPSTPLWSPSLAALKRRLLHQTSAPHIATLRQTHRTLPLLLAATGIAGGLGISSLAFSSTLLCDGIPPPLAGPPPPPPPQSSVSVYELTFGTACGLCAGVFVKKSARMIAFFLGGLFVVLQYLHSVSLVKVDWELMASRFENLLYTIDAAGDRRPPTVRSIWKWTVDFLTADFQPRASFVAGLALGLRVG